jgi:hypothetical protein
MLNIFRKGTLHLGKVLRQRNSDEVLGQNKKVNAAWQHKMLNIFRKGTLHLGKGADAKDQRRSPGSEQEG